MIEAVLVFGVIIFAGIAAVLWKLPVPIRRWVLGHDMLLDISVTGLVLWIHWGTMTGLMSATVAGFTCALASKFARWGWGYTHRGKFVPGHFSHAQPAVLIGRRA